MIGAGDFLNIFVGQFKGAAIDEMAEVAGVNKQDLILTWMITSILC